MQIAGQNLKHNADIKLPASKSVANRALILNALAGNKTNILNNSQARDSQTMQRLLNTSPKVLDVLDAGTTMRFLTAFSAIGNEEKIMTGTERMKQRPIGILVEALKQIGAKIEYFEKSGYPPLHIFPFQRQAADHISVQGDVSSQFISALMMIAPVLPNGLTMELTGKVGSRPYIIMTKKLMEAFGAHVEYHDHTIRISATGYTPPATFTIEPDWSGASYWYSILALSDLKDLKIRDLKEVSYQGDQVIVDIMAELGITTKYLETGALLQKTPPKTAFEFDFSDCPDLAQTVMVVCAAKAIPCVMTGLESLKIKETNRVAAMKSELQKIGADLMEKGDKWEVVPTTKIPQTVKFKCYEDHRMAMSLAPLASLTSVEFDDPEVVNKSFPTFWKEMEKLGFKVDF